MEHAIDLPAGEAPLFRTLGDYRPRPAAIMGGGFLSLASLCAVTALIAVGAKTGVVFLVGVHHPSPHLLPVARESVAEGRLNTTVQFGPEPEDPLRAVASLYFRRIRVLSALDADQDLVITQWEMITAPAALRRLDTDHDGRLTAEECGFRPPEGAQALTDFIERARRAFMRVNPVLAALDADGDGVISAAEIANSYAALKKLDRNHDGSLTADELLPDHAATQAAMMLAWLDADGDGAISSAEQAEDPALRELLHAADHNHDGRVTEEELRTELQFHAERKRELEVALGASGRH